MIDSVLFSFFFNSLARGEQKENTTRSAQGRPRDPVAILPPVPGAGPAMHNARVELVVEALCHRGCRAVWDIIDTLENGGELPETGHLTGVEVGAVITELRAIMAVYGHSCPASD
jgi:hypothetical protein